MKMLAIAAVLFAAALTCMTAAGFAVPSGISAYVPIQLTNQQGSAFTQNSQVMVTVNSLAYKGYESSNLQNVEFFYSNGTVIPSWLEGNVLNEEQAANIYASQNTVYWLRFYQANTLLPALSSNYVYMGFAANTVELLGNTVTGEAPQLSQTYAQYDNGANIFTTYYNYQGTSVPYGLAVSSDGVSGSVTFANMVTVASTNALGGQAEFLYGTSTASPANQIIDALFISGNTDINDKLIGWDEASPASQGGSGSWWGWVNGVTAGFHNNPEAVGISSDSPHTTSSGSATMLTPTVVSLFWPSSSSANGIFGYASVQALSTDIPAIANSYPVYGFTSNGGSNVVYQWGRTRIAPPNGAMALASFGQAVGFFVAPNPPRLTNTVIDVGQVSVANAVLGGGIGPYYGGWTFTSSNGVLANNLTATITGTGTAPFAIALNPQGTLAYLTDYSGGSSGVTVINTITGTVVNTISGMANPETIVVNSQGTRAYTLEDSGSSGVVFTINTATNSISNTMTVFNCATCGDYIGYLALNPQGTLLYVAEPGVNSIYTVSTTTNAVVNTISLGAGSDGGGVVFNPQGTSMYVANAFGSTIFVINPSTNSISNTISLGTYQPAQLAINPQGSLLYSLDGTNSVVSVISTATNSVVNTIPVGSDSQDIALNPQGTLAYVTNYAADTVNIIDTATNSVIATPAAGLEPNGVASSPLGTSVYVADEGSTTVSVISPSETAIGSLYPSNAIALAINAVSANTVSFTFNGVTQTITAPGTANVYGLLSLFGFGEDGTTGLGSLSGLTGTNAVATSAAYLTIDPSPNATALTPSSTSPLVGQAVTYNVLIMGGTGPFTVNLVATNNDTVMNTITGAQAGIVAFGPITPPLGTDTYSVVATDSGTTTPVLFSSASDEITVTVPPSAWSGTTAGGVGGSGGSGKPTVTAPNTTPTSSTSTTIPQRHEVEVNAASGTMTLCNANASSYDVKYESFGATFHVVPENSTCITFMAVNVTDSPTTVPLPANTSAIILLNVSIVGGALEANATIAYPCAIGPSLVAPYTLENGIWAKVNLFTLNSTACTATFAIPNDPVVALLETVIPQASSTTTIPAVKGPVSPSHDYLYAAAALILILAVLLLFAITMKKRRGQRKTR